MTEKIARRLEDLKARQMVGEPMRCPRCGADTMKEPVHTNALSRIADIYICDACGSAEAMLAFMNQQYPLTSWWAFQLERPESNFRELPAGDVLMRVQLEQIGMLTDICTKCMANALGITYRTLLNNFRHLGREKGGNVAFQHLIPYCLENGFSMDEIYREYRKAADPETR